MNPEPVWQYHQPLCFDSTVQGTVYADVAIVGGGFAGLSSAYHLLTNQPSQRVIVLEAGCVGSGASGRNTGMLGPGVGQNLLGLVSRLGDSGAESVYQQTLRAVGLVQELITTENIACDLSMGGQIHWARSIPSRQRLAAQAAWLSGHGLPVEIMDDEVLRGYIHLPETFCRLRNLPVALRLPVAGVLDPGKFVSGLARVARHHGAQIFESSLVSEIKESARYGEVELSIAGGGKVLAGQVILATAGYTDSLDWLPGRIIPMELQVLATESIPAKILDKIGWQRREGIIEARRIFNYFRLSADNRIIFGGGAPRPCPAKHQQIQILPSSAWNELSDGLSTTFPELSRQGIRVTHAWKGTIGYVINGIPVIGRSHENPKIFHAVGWSGHGVALAVAAGRWLADLITQNPRQDESADALALFNKYPPKLPFRRMHGFAIRAGVSALRMMDRFT